MSTHPTFLDQINVCEACDVRPVHKLLSNAARAHSLTCVFSACEVWPM